MIFVCFLIFGFCTRVLICKEICIPMMHENQHPSHKLNNKSTLNLPIKYVTSPGKNNSQHVLTDDDFFRYF